MHRPDDALLARLVEGVVDRSAIDWPDDDQISSEPLRRKVHYLRAIRKIEEISRSSDTEETAPLPQPVLREDRETWGPLQIIEPLGSGGYGDVYRAFDPALKSEVALKLLRRTSTAENETDSFHAEARKLARIRHPNVLTVHGVATHDNLTGLWTELLEGSTLAQSLATHGPYSAHESALIGVDLCRALAAVHRVGLIHRDVKAANVMRERGGRIVLLDFSAGAERTQVSSSPTAGTPLYMAPELFSDEPSGVGVDIYALGVLLYKLVSGHYPIEADSVEELRRAHSARKPTPLLDRRPDLPPAYARVVERALSTDPANRYQSAGEMEQDLAALVGGTATIGSHTREAGPRRGLLALAAVAVIVVAVWFVRSSQAPFTVHANWFRSGGLTGAPLESGSAVKPGDCVELELRGSRNMNVYVLNEDANGLAKVLFPVDGVEHANPLRADRTLRLPGTIDGKSRCWTLGGGGETMVVIASAAPLGDLELLIADLPGATDPIGDSRGVVGLGPAAGSETDSQLSEIVRRLSHDAEEHEDLWVSRVWFRGDSNRSSSIGSWEIERLERQVEDHPKDPSSRLALAKALLGNPDDPRRFRDHVRAYELAASAASQRPLDDEPRLVLADALGRMNLADGLLTGEHTTDRDADPLADWADMYLAGKSARADQLLRRENDSALVADAFQVIRDRMARGAVADVTALAAAHRDFREIDREIDRRACSETKVRLADALAVFRQADSPYRLLALQKTATCRYYANEYDDAETMLDDVLRQAAANNYRDLLGTTHWLLGMSLSRRSRYSAGASQFARAAEIFAAVGDRAQLAAARNLEAQTLDALGQNKIAWERRHAAVSGLHLVEDPRRKHQILFSTATAAGRDGFLRFALALGDLAGASALESGDTLAYVAIALRQAEFLLRLDRRDEAVETLENAKQRTTTLPESTRDEFGAEIAIVEAALQVDHDPEAAVSALSKAIAFYRKGEQRRLFRLYPLRGRAYLEAGRVAEAEADLRAGIDFFEGERPNVDSEPARITHSDLAEQVFDEMVRFQIVSRNREDAALDYAERGRGRIVTSAVPVMANEIAKGLPDSVALVYYSILDDRLLTWAVYDGGVRLVQQSIERQTIADQVTRFRMQIQAGRDNEILTPRSERLYDLLIRPVLQDIELSTTLVIVADESLHLLPFAALLNRETGRYLIQERALAVAPNATSALRHFQRSPSGLQVRTALIVGNPDFDRKLFGYLPALPGAAVEAQAVAALYPSARLLIGAAATRPRLLDGLRSADVLHFAGHAISDTTDPMHSLLVLAPDKASGDTGEVPAESLHQEDPLSTQLVVLAACSTATGYVSATEGAISLARPFLASGVPTVVATLWQIDDRASVDLFTSFHRNYRESRDSVAALRQAQIRLLNGEDRRTRHPRFWAAAIAILGAGNSQTADRT